MLTILILLLPCFIFLGYFALLLERKGKTVPDKYLLAVCILGAITFFGDAANLHPTDSSIETTIIDVILPSGALLLFAAIILYIRSLSKLHLGRSALSAIGIPAVLYTAAVVLRLAVGRSFLLNHPYILVTLFLALAVLEALILHFCFFDLRPGSESSDAIRIRSRSRHADPFRANASEDPLPALQSSQAEFSQHNDPFRESASEDPLPERTIETTSALARRFKEYMEEEKAYLRADLTLESAAADLSTNRTYLSECVRKDFGTNFRDYVNSLRIEAAKKELLAHPGDNLSSIASRTGFASSSQLVKKFQEMTGMTPRRWSKSVDESKF